MLTLVLGRSGCGKTVYAVIRAGELAAKSQSVVMLAPEQFTYEMEKQLLHTAGAQSCLRVEVLSFTRLVERVMKECGGLAARYIDDSGKTLIMRLALVQLKGLLKIYGRQSDSPAFARTMLDSVSEYKTSGISPEMFGTAAGKLRDGLLRQKLDDIALIMRTYNALLEKDFSDPLDGLERLREKLLDYPFFHGKTVILDAFNGFTPPEKRVLDEIFRQADDVIVTLCTDSLEEPAGAPGLFSTVKKTARSLIAQAGRCGVRVAAPVRLGGPERFQSPALRHLEQNVFRAQPEAFSGQPEEIRLACARNIYDEAQYAAQTIAALVREKHCRYRDITVITGDLSQYRGILEPAFKKYGVPLFFDNRRPVDTHPLMILVLSLLDILAGNFRSDPIFRYLKTGLAGFEIEDVSILENYVLTWDIKGRESWENVWNQHPRGYGFEFTPEDRQELEKINGIRARFVEPLLSLRKRMERAETCADISREIFDYLELCEVPKKIDEICGKLEEDGELALADEYSRIWEVFVGALDQIVLIMKDRRADIREFSVLFNLVISGCELRQIPSSLDEVTAGTAGLIRAGSPEYVFVVGLAEGIFPQNVSASAIFSQAERKKLVSCGLELSGEAGERAAEERFFAYKAFTSASKGLFLSYPSSDAAGRQMRPSYFLNAVRALFPGCRMSAALEPPLNSLQNEASAFELLALGFRRNDSLTAALKSWFEKRPEYAGRLEALQGSAENGAFRFRESGVSRQLYGETMRISPSRAETHRLCRFLYFCRYGVGALPRKKAELAAPEIGTLIHFVLEKLLSQTKKTKIQDVPAEELQERIREILAEFTQRFLGGLEGKSQRFLYQLQRLEENVTVIVENIARELSQSEFIPVDFELSIAENGDVKPYTLTLESGGALKLEGKADRVDIMKKNGKTYLRVVDYKSGLKVFSLADVVNGLNLQMLIYLFTLCRNGSARYAPGCEITPAGVLYVPVKRPDLTGARNESEEAVRSAEAKALKMNGLICSDGEAAAGMEREGRGVFIPAKFKAVRAPDGSLVSCEFDARASVASLKRLGLLEKHIEKTLRDMVNTLREGDIAAVPVSGNGYDPCSYCDYRSVCGHEASGPVDHLISCDRDEAWKLLENENPDDETRK